MTIVRSSGTAPARGLIVEVAQQVLGGGAIEVVLRGRGDRSRPAAASPRSSRTSLPIA